MRLSLLSVVLSLTSVALSLHLELEARSVSPFSGVTLAATGDDHEDTIATTNDILYIANVTIDGTSYPLQMDTGSSDLWLQLQSTPTNVTTTTLNLTYGTGYTYGPIARGAVSLAGYNIASQAYLVFQSGANPIFQFGAVGIVGLGLTGLSHIDAAVDQNGVTWGRSLLENIFALNTSSANYIAMALEREGDQASTVQGSLGVGEVAPQYANITSTAHIPLFPPQGSERWTILLDSFAVNGVENTVTSSVTDVPAGHVSILLDSGTTYSYAGPAVASAIYSGISGAVLDSTSNQWQVPCSAGIRLTLWIAGRPFDIHPLDVVIPSLSDSSQCIGSFMPSTLSVGSNSYDWILGTNVLRSLYTLYDFGDYDSNNVMGDPYIQLLSVVDIDAAASDFQNTRGGTVNVGSGDGNASAPVTVLTTDQKVDELLNLIPMMFAVLGANALILLALVSAGIWLFCYLRKQKRKPKKATGLAPLQLSSVTSRDHAYEAVNTNDVDEARPSSLHTRHSIRPLSRTGSKQSLSSRSMRDGIPELGHHSNASHSSLLRPSISISTEDVSAGGKRIPIGGGSDSRRSSRLTPTGPGSPNLMPQNGRHSKIPSNLIPASPSPTAPFFSSSSLQSIKGEDEGLVDVSLVPHDEAGDVANLKADMTGKHLDLADETSSIKKNRYVLDPPPPISVIGPGMRDSMASDMSASPTVAGSEVHFVVNGDKGGRERTMSAYIPNAQERPGVPFGMARPNSSYVPERPARGSTGEPSRLRLSSLNSNNEPSPLRQSSLNSELSPSPLRQSSINSNLEPSPLRQSSMNSNEPAPSPTESQGYYSHPNYSTSNASLSAFPVPPENAANGRKSMLTTPNSSLQAPAAIHVPSNTPMSAVPIVVEGEASLSYLNEDTPPRSPTHSITHSRTPPRSPTHSITPSRTASPARTHTRTPSQGQTHSRSGSHARTPSQTLAQTQMQATQAQRQQQQEAQRAAFMAALDEPLLPPRRPRVPGSGGGGDGLTVGQDRMSAYQLGPTLEAQNAAQFNRYSYAPGTGGNMNQAGVGTRGFPLTDPGSSGGPQRSSYVSGSPLRRGPFMSNPSPFNPHSGNGSGPS